MGYNHQIVDASEFDEESAQELVERLTEQGVDAVQVFDNPEDARDYAIQLLAGLGVESEENVEEPVQAEFSDHTIYVTKFYTNNTEFMTRMFSEAVNDIDASQDSIEDAIENGDEIETDTEIITPIDAKTAVIEDKENGEFTKAVMDDEVLDVTPISEEEAEELTDHITIDEDSEVDEDSEEEKEFSTLDKFFAEALTPAVESAGQMMFNVDAQGNPISPVAEEAPVAEPTPEVVPGAPSVESIEDKAAAAVQSIQAAAAEAEAAILNAKSAPVENAEEDLKEAQFSEEDNTNDIAGEGTLLTWLGDIKR